MKIKNFFKDKGEIPSWILTAKEERNLTGRKKRDTSKKSLYNKVLWCTIIAIIVIAILTILSMLCFGMASPKFFDKKAEATLLASGLSIVGIAISVWAGLNIINALERGDVENVQTTLAGIKEQLDKLATNIEGIELIESEQNKIYRGFFLNELLKTDYDAMSRYFYKCFYECKNIKTVEYVKLVLVEQYFSQIYLEYENQSLKSFVLGRAYDGVQLIDTIIDQCNKEWLYEEQEKEHNPKYCY